MYSAVQKSPLISSYIARNMSQQTQWFLVTYANMHVQTVYRESLYNSALNPIFGLTTDILQDSLNSLIQAFLSFL